MLPQYLSNVPGFDPINLEKLCELPFSNETPVECINCKPSVGVTGVSSSKLSIFPLLRSWR